MNMGRSICEELGLKPLEITTRQYQDYIKGMTLQERADFNREIINAKRINRNEQSKDKEK